jgi:hypothetical protein
MLLINYKSSEFVGLLFITIYHSTSFSLVFLSRFFVSQKLRKRIEDSLTKLYVILPAVKLLVLEWLQGSS